MAERLAQSTNGPTGSDRGGKEGRECTHEVAKCKYAVNEWLDGRRDEWIYGWMGDWLHTAEKRQFALAEKILLEQLVSGLRGRRS